MVLLAPMLPRSLNQLPGMLWTTDRDLRLTAVMGADAAVFTSLLKDVLGRRVNDLIREISLLIPLPNLTKGLDAHDAALRGERRAYNFAVGSVWYETTLGPLYDDAGSITGVIGVCQDITRRKQAELALETIRSELEQRVIERTEELEALNAQLQYEVEVRVEAERAAHHERGIAQALYQVALSLNASLRLGEVLERLLDHLESVVPHDQAAVFLLEGGWLTVAQHRSHTPHITDHWMHGQRFRAIDYPTFHHMAQSGEAILVADVRQYPLWLSDRETDWIRSYLSLPIRLEGSILGFLSLYSAHLGFFTDEQATILKAFAAQAAIAINNAQLHQKAQALAALEERQKLARELHDAISQTLLSANMIADSLPRLVQRDPARADEGFTYLRRLIRGALAELRALLMELRPAALAQANLNVLIQQLAEAVTSRKEIEIDLKLDTEYMIADNAKVAIYRITQEALNNVVKHSSARRVAVSLKKLVNGVELSVADDGRGFELGTVSSDHMGMTIMRERANEIGARLTIESRIGFGTKVTLRWTRTARPAQATGK
jgi:two-component system nitrate/nitrite sensor histidine kinase NarX